MRFYLRSHEDDIKLEPEEWLMHCEHSELLQELLTKTMKIVVLQILSRHLLIPDSVGSNIEEPFVVKDQLASIPHHSSPPETSPVTFLLYLRPWSLPLGVEIVLVGAVVHLLGLHLEERLVVQILAPTGARVNAVTVQNWKDAAIFAKALNADKSRQERSLRLQAQQVEVQVAEPWSVASVEHAVGEDLTEHSLRHEVCRNKLDQSLWRVETSPKDRCD